MASPRQSIRPKDNDLQGLSHILESNPSFGGALILAMVMVLVTILLMLTYFFLFLYNRLRHPDKDRQADDREEVMLAALEAVKAAARSEPQNQFVLTKEDLQVRGGRMGQQVQPSGSSLSAEEQAETLTEDSIGGGRQRSSKEGKAASVADSAHSSRLSALRMPVEKYTSHTALSRVHHHQGQKPRKLYMESTDKKRRQWIEVVEQQYRDYMNREIQTATDWSDQHCLPQQRQSK